MSTGEHAPADEAVGPMPDVTLTEHAQSAAPPEAVWKLLYDPARFADWWAGAGRSEVGAAGDAGTDFTYWFDGYPDLPMPQRIRSDRRDGRVTISCLVSGAEMAWTLAEAPGGGTSIEVRAAVPRTAPDGTVAAMRGYLEQSVRRLADVAAREG